MESKVIRLYKNREIKRSTFKVFFVLAGVIILAVLFTWPLYDSSIYSQAMVCVAILAFLCMVLLFLRTGRLVKRIGEAKSNVLAKLNTDEITELDDSFSEGFHLGDLVLAGRYIVSISLDNFFIIPLRDVRKLYVGKRGMYLSRMVDCMFLEDSSGRKYNVLIKKRNMPFADKFIEEALKINRHIQAKTSAGNVF